FALSVHYPPRPSSPTRRSADLQDERQPQRALGERVADLGGGLLTHRRRSRHLQQDLPGIPWHPHREPPHEAEVDVRADLEAELADRKSTRLNSSHVKIAYAVCC